MTFLLMLVRQSSFFLLFSHANQNLNNEFRRYMTSCNCLKFQFNSPLRFLNAIDMINITCVIKHLAR